MKSAIVIPVHKKDDTQDCNDYVPIPFLPNIRKFGKLKEQTLKVPGRK